MRLVADALQQLERRRVVRQHHRRTPARLEDLLDPLGQAHDRHAQVAERLQGLEPRRELALPAVDHDQARDRGEAGVVVALVRRALALRHELRHPPGQHLVHGREIVLGHIPDPETPVVRLLGRRPLERHHRGHRVGLAEVGDVEALDAHRDLLHAEFLLQPLERLDALHTAVL